MFKNLVFLSLQCVYGCSDEELSGVEGGEWRLPDLLYVNDLALCVESEEALKVMWGGGPFCLGV